MGAPDSRTAAHSIIRNQFFSSTPIRASLPILFRFLTVVQSSCESGGCRFYYRFKRSSCGSALTSPAELAACIAFFLGFAAASASKCSARATNEKSQNFQSGDFDLCAPHSPNTEQHCHSKSPKRGPTHLRLPETRLPLRIGSVPSWRLLARLDSVAGCHQKRICVLLRPRVLDLSLIRNLSCMRCFRVVVSPFSECAKNLSEHDRFEINVERDPYPHNVGSKLLTSQLHIFVSVAV